MKYWRDLKIGEIISGSDRVYTYKGWSLFSEMDNVGVGEPVTRTHGPIQREIPKQVEDGALTIVIRRSDLPAIVISLIAIAISVYVFVLNSAL